MRWAGLVALALIPLAGCVAPPPDCAAAADLAVGTPRLGAQFLATDARQPWDTLVMDEQAEDQTVTTNVTAAPSDWTVSATAIANGTSGPHLLLVRAQPTTATSANVTLSWTATRASEGCMAGSAGHVRWALAPPKPGAVGQVGSGVRVLTAGFFENGTLFYTNIEAIHNDTQWARSPIYSWDGSAPLPVYVYDHERSERPSVWAATTAGTPVGPATGNMTAWNYYTTIPGFNDALKGLSTNTVRVVHLAPDEAYTDANHTAHPLYGLPLVFLIKVVAVDELPCADAAPACLRPPTESGLLAPGIQVP